MLLWFLLPGHGGWSAERAESALGCSTSEWRARPVGASGQGITVWQDLTSCVWISDSTVFETSEDPHRQFGLLSRGRAVFVDEIWTQCRAQQLRCIIRPKFHVQSRGTQCQRMHPIFLIDFRTWGSLATDKLKDDWSFAAKVRLFKKLASTCPKMRTRTRPATQRSLTNVTRLRSCAAVTPCVTGDSRLLGDCAWRSNQVQDPYHQNDCQGDATQLDLVSIFAIIFEFSDISYVICPLSSCKLKSFRTKTDLSLPKSVCPWVVASLHTFKAGCHALHRLHPGCATVACSALRASTTRSAALDLGKNLKQQRGGRDMQGPQGRMNTGNQI